MAKDYYLVLGIGSDATLDQIKSAYRRKAKRWHPDHCGEGSEAFLDVQEAYEVLGDPERRRAYDDELAHEQRIQHGAREVGPEPLRRRRCPVEPLVPTQRSSRPRDVLSGSSFPPTMTERFRRLCNDLDSPIRHETGRAVEEIHIEVSLTREQALYGGRIRVWLPVQIRCSACRGRGGVGVFECPYCLGRGTVVEQYPVDVAFPGGLAEGLKGSVSLRRPGLGDLSLVLHFRLDGW